jgi:hypothetical protein
MTRVDLGVRWSGESHLFAYPGCSPARGSICTKTAGSRTTQQARGLRRTNPAYQVGSTTPVSSGGKQRPEVRIVIGAGPGKSRANQHSTDEDHSQNERQFEARCLSCSRNATSNQKQAYEVLLPPA